MPKSLTHYKALFLEHLLHIQGASSLTVKTYDIALTQMLNSAEIDGKEKIIYLMPFRHTVAQQSKKTITKKLSAIRSFVRFLEEIHSLSYTLKDDTPVKINKSLPKPIEHRHIMEAIAAANEDEKLLVVMLYSLGLRISELSAIRLDAIKKGWIRVTGKGNKMRDVPLNDSLYQAMQRYIEKYTPKTYFFEHKQSKLSEDSLRYKLIKIFKRIGIKATPHQLRHAYATELLNGGARIEQISELLGHESLATTQIYTQLASKQKMQNYRKAHPLEMMTKER